MSIELRWLTPAGTTTEPMRLQYKVLGDPYKVSENGYIRRWSEWMDVPVVVDEVVEGEENDQ